MRPLSLDTRVILGSDSHAQETPSGSVSAYTLPSLPEMAPMLNEKGHLCNVLQLLQCLPFAHTPKQWYCALMSTLGWYSALIMLANMELSTTVSISFVLHLKL